MKPLKTGSIVAAAAAAAVGAVILLKDRLFPVEAPAAAPTPEPKPAPAAPARADQVDDDLTSVKGIGPVYRTRLNAAGITTFSDLAGAKAAAIAEKVDVPEARVADWIAQAAQFVRI